MTRSRSRVFLLILTLGLLALVAGRSVRAHARMDDVPMLAPSLESQLADRYIVVFGDETRQSALADAAEQAERLGARLDYVYRTALKGFSGTFTDQALASMREDPNVAYIEADALVSLMTTWGLDRIDQRYLPLDGNYGGPVTGSDVHAYVIDTGIRSSHTEFGGRVLEGFTAVADGNGTDDCHGHGTHVAGTIGGETYGVAPGVALHPVRVLSCSGSGTNSGVIAGIDWVAANYVSPAVANMSLGGTASTAVDDAVKAATSAGVLFAVAAGNSDADACNTSPARVPEALTVGATGPSDQRASFSNWGPCLDLFAPGVDITSAWYTNDAATNTISGTSMASPHVAGVAAMARALDPGASPAAIAEAVIASATRGVVSDNVCSPVLLLYAGLIPDPTPLPNPGPCPDPGTCAADMVLADRQRVSAVDAMRLADSLYRFRDDVLADSALGRRYHALYEQHTARLSVLLMRSPRLRQAALDLLVDHAVGLDQLAGNSAERAVLTMAQIDRIERFLLALAAEDRQLGGGALAETIEIELGSHDWSELAGLEYDAAWRVLTEE